MKNVDGIWLPDSEQHLLSHVIGSPKFARGSTYQFRKFASCFPLIKSFEVAVDIGAHCGLWTRVLARCFGEVWAFEPLRSNLLCLEKNVEDDKRRVIVVPCALGDGSVDRVFIKEKSDTGTSHVSTDGAGHEVSCKMIDGFGIDHLDFMKIDVEGFETAVITGGEQTIRSCEPVIIIEQKPNNAERFGYAQYQASEMLQSWGMKEVVNLGDDLIMVW